MSDAGSGGRVRGAGSRAAAGVRTAARPTARMAPRRSAPLCVALAVGLLAGTTSSAAARPVAAAPAPAAAAKPAAAGALVVPGVDAIRTLTLGNGMTVIVWPDRDIPNVALYNFVRVGSRNEAPGITGLAHFFEHMMFNGTARRAPGEFDREMEAQGGANNAFTSQDLTVYQDWFPRSALELIFDLEGDRLANLAFDPKVVESERGVVFSERRLNYEDNNANFLGEQVEATAFVAHPYQIPTIGWPSDIRGWKMQDLQAFYRRHYAPNNCTLVLVGDVSADEAFALARRYLEPIPRQEPPEPVRTREPEQLGERRVRVERRAQTPLLQFAYKATAAGDPQTPAVELLLAVLGDGDSSRLHRELVEKQKLAISVGSYLSGGFDPGLAWFVLAAPQGGDVVALERAFDAQIARVVAGGVTEAELRRAKNMVAAAFWQSMATIDGKARKLGEYAVLHDGWRALFEAPGKYEAVTVADLQAAAREILQARKRTVGVLVPPAARAEAAPVAAQREAGAESIASGSGVAQ